MTETRTHAVPRPPPPPPGGVLGGSLGGLLAAAALAPHVGRVVIVERDTLGTEPFIRAGTPQALHAHGLLASGAVSMESLLPGLIDDLLAGGAVRGGEDIGSNGVWYIGGGRVADCEVGANGVAASRLLIEATVRSRVRALDRVDVRDHTEVRGLRGDSAGRGVAGVHLRDVTTGVEEVLDADLVVDATGRPGRARRWFEEHGWEPAPEERVDVGVRYASTHIPIQDGDLDGRAVLVSAATPEIPRGGVAIRQEGGTWVVLLFGYAENQPPVDPDGFRGYAATVAAPELARLLERHELLEPPRAYRFPHCVRRRVEKATLPAGYVAIGDAICSFDPTFGQGMSVAALQAVALREVVGSAHSLLGIAGTYHQRAAEIVDRAWLIVVGADVQIPGCVGQAPPGHAVTSRWVRRVHRAARRDPVVARQLMRVTNLFDAPPSLFHPRIVGRVLRDMAAA